MGSRPQCLGSPQCRFQGPCGCPQLEVETCEVQKGALATHDSPIVLHNPGGQHRNVEGPYRELLGSFIARKAW
jgi:hypothetical protein